VRIFILKAMYRFYYPESILFLKCVLVLILLFLNSHAFADSGSDLLQGTDQSAWATFEGTGKKYIYLGEGLLALFTYIKTKNVLTLIGIVVVAIFIDIILKMAGQS
jgi:hypothetical protein